MLKGSKLVSCQLCIISNRYCQNCRGGSLGQVEAVDVDIVAKWRQNLI